MIFVFFKRPREDNYIIDISASAVAIRPKDIIQATLDVLDAVIVAYKGDVKVFLATIAINSKLVPIFFSDELLVEEGDYVNYTNILV